MKAKEYPCRTFSDLAMLPDTVFEKALSEFVDGIRAAHSVWAASEIMVKLAGKPDVARSFDIGTFTFIDDGKQNVTINISSTKESK